MFVRSHRTSKHIFAVKLGVVFRLRAACIATPVELEILGWSTSFWPRSDKSTGHRAMACSVSNFAVSTLERSFELVPLEPCIVSTNLLGNIILCSCEHEKLLREQHQPN